MHSTKDYNLEYRLFVTACMLGLVVSSLLFLVDTFVAHEYDSSVVGVFSILINAIFYYQVRFKHRHRKLVIPYAIYLMIIINVAWFTGGGMNVTNAFIFLLSLLVITIIVPASHRNIFIVLIFINLLVFMSMEFWYPAYSMPVIKNDRLLVINTIVLLISFGIAAYITIFFKNQYEKERRKVHEQNLKLDASYSEIEAQNEELIQYQEEVMAQRDFIEEKNKKLEQQTLELEKANELIKNSNEQLEKMVEERTKRLTELNNDLDLLVYRSSHDFRRPLTTLMGLNEIARLTINDDLSKELFQKMNDTALNMDKMLLKFFMLYSINHYHKTYEGSTIQEVVDRLDKEMISKKRDISFHQNIQLVTYQDQDERNGLIEIILENLFENALIYNSKKHIELKLDIVEHEGNLMLSLTDNGNGIPQSYRDKIFEMYFRGSTLSTGNGLGLYVVRRAAKLLQADVQVESAEGEYTRFLISFKI